MSQSGSLIVSGSGGSPIETLTGNTGGPVGPDGAFNINIVGNTTMGITVVGNAGMNTLNIVASQSTTTQFGTILLATNSQAIAGTDPNNAVTSAALAAKLGTQTQFSLPIGAGSSSAISWTAPPTDGQILIGSTSLTPVLNTITAGSGITVTNGAGTITIATTGGGAGITTINGDTGSVTGSVIDLLGTPLGGSSVSFDGSSTTMNLKLSDLNSNTILGEASGNGTITGVLNTSVGCVSLTSLTSGFSNTIVGAQAMNALQTGSRNVGFGLNAGVSLVSGNDNIFLGYESGVSYTTSESSNILLGNFGALGESHVIRIGTQGSGDGEQSTCYIAGIQGVSVSNLNIVTVNTSTGQLGSQAAANVGTVTQFDVLVGGAAGAIASVGPGSTGQVLQSGGAAANPVYSTATYPGSTTINRILYSTANNAVGQLATANQGVLTTTTAGVPAITPIATDGQIIIGSTAGNPAAGTLTPGSGISISNASNSITISVNGATVGQTITGNTGGAISPTAGNWNTVGTGSVTIAGSGSTLTTQLTGLTNHAVLVGAGTATITKISPTANTGAILQNNSGADPSYSTATYPSTATTAQQLLVANGTNWVGKSLSVVKQVFTTSGTYTPTSGMVYCTVECLGGGAAGGGAAATGATTVSTGGGGGGGEYAQGVFSAATIGASQAVTIGAGGTGISGATGNNGGNTSLGALISANGGSAGLSGVIGTTANALGGLGGTGGSGGSFRTPGNAGGWGLANNAPGFVTGGSGANSQYGAGGNAVVTVAAGAAALGFGSGGGGGANYISGSNSAGGNGTSGIVAVTEYVIA